MKIKAEDLSYIYNHFGYMIRYKNEPIGGAGTIGRTKKDHRNLAFHKEQAEVTINEILQGRIPEHMKKVILKIKKRYRSGG